MDELIYKDYNNPWDKRLYFLTVKMQLKKLEMLCKKKMIGVNKHICLFYLQDQKSYKWYRLSVPELELSSSWCTNYSKESLPP